ncbi:hypothetical protein SO802_011061 [Lithocarpus litseifolius]|uniref:Uncharacterized protein n=1 Tax=Lithocarpus litseifolius TaxID=425828 RepID=A0AAW2DHE6_9ROSI
MFESSKRPFSIKGLISTVPDHLRKLNEQAFTPRLISVGPIHFSNVKLQNMSQYKVRFYNFQWMSLENLNPKNFNGEIEHFADLIRIFHLSSPLPGRSIGVEKLLYTATQLHGAGVKFKVSSNKSLLDIKCDLKDGVLEIPSLMLHDETVDLIQNLIVLEQSRFMGKADITDYFVILDFLINTTKDMDLLCEKGILVNYLGDSTAATSAFNNINTNILLNDMNSDY